MVHKNLEERPSDHAFCPFEAIAMILAMSINIYRHYSMNLEARRIVELNVGASFLEVLGSKTEEWIRKILRKNMELTKIMSFNLSAAGFNSIVIFDEVLSFLVLYEIYLCTSKLKKRVPSLRKLFAKAGFTLLVIITIAAAMISVRAFVSNSGQAFVTFLNIYPTKIAIKGVITCVDVLMVAKIVLSVRKSEQFRVTSGAKSRSSNAFLIIPLTITAVQVCSLTGRRRPKQL